MHIEKYKINTKWHFLGEVTKAYTNKFVTIIEYVQQNILPRPQKL